MFNKHHSCIANGGRERIRQCHMNTHAHTHTLATHTLATPQAKADRHVVKEQVLQAARSFFRPEFLNRLDDIVVFDPLSDVSCICGSGFYVSKFCFILFHSVSYAAGDAQDRVPCVFLSVLL